MPSTMQVKWHRIEDKLREMEVVIMGKNDFFDKLEENVIAVGIIIMVIMETLNVICSKFLPSFAGIPEELAIFSYIWVCFLCTSFCTKKGCNIVVDVLSARYNKKIQQYLKLLQYIVDAVLGVLFVYGSILFVTHTKAAGKIGLTGIPLWIIYIAPIAGFGLSILRNIQMILKISKKTD